MKTLLTILSKPNQTFGYLEKKYEDVSSTDYDFIFLVFGAFSGLISFLVDSKSASILIGIHPAIAGLFMVLLGAGASFVFGRHIIAPITYWIGKALKGHAEMEQIRITIAYSWIPLFFKIPVGIYYGATNNPIMGFEYWIMTGLSLLTYIWALKIELQGLMYFNKYGLLNAIVNKLPFLVIQSGYFYWILTIR